MRRKLEGRYSHTTVERSRSGGELLSKYRPIVRRNARPFIEVWVIVRYFNIRHSAKKTVTPHLVSVNHVYNLKRHRTRIGRGQQQYYTVED